MKTKTEERMDALAARLDRITDDIEEDIRRIRTVAATLTEAETLRQVASRERERTRDQHGTVAPEARATRSVPSKSTPSTRSFASSTAEPETSNLAS